MERATLPYGSGLLGQAGSSLHQELARSHSANQKLPASDLPPPPHAIGWSAEKTHPSILEGGRNPKQVSRELVSPWLCRAPGKEIKYFLFLPWVALPGAPRSTI